MADATPWLTPIADEIRCRAASERTLAAWERERMVKKLDLAGVFDAIAVKLEAGGVPPELLQEAVAALTPSSRLLLRKDEEDEATRLRRVFGIAPIEADGEAAQQAVGDAIAAKPGLQLHGITIALGPDGVRWRADGAFIPAADRETPGEPR